MSLATKYRPGCFEDLIGQEHVISTILGMLQTSRINQTLLIYGPWGSGKTTTARLLARYLNCMAPNRGVHETPCGECQPCRYANDVEEINAASVRGIDSIRAMISRADLQPISGGRYNIFVLDEAHQLTKQAVQALLKITEEPPPNSLFVLCTTDPQCFPPALKSRCIKLGIRQVSPEMTATILKRIIAGEELDTNVYNDDVLMAIALAVDGHPRDAIMTLETVIARVEARGNLQVDDISEFVLNVVQEEAGERPDQLATRYLLYCYRGKYTTPIEVLKQVVRHGDFLSHIIRFHSQTLYYTFGKKLREDDYRPWYRLLDEQFRNGLDVDCVVDLMELFVDASRRVQAYQTDGYYDVMNMTLQAVRRCKTA